MDKRMTVDAGDLLYERGSDSDLAGNEEALRWIRDAKARQDASYKQSAGKAEGALDGFCRKFASLGWTMDNGRKV